MTTTKIDKFGRVLIPKKIRQAAGLAPGTKVEVRCVKGNVRLKSAASVGRLVRKKNGRLVWSGSGPTAPHDLVKFIDELREERLRQTLGLDTP